MKKLLLLLAFAFMVVMPMSASIIEDTTLIRNFYTEYQKAWKYEDARNFDTFEYTDKVLEKYTTDDFITKIQKSEVQYDYPSDDFGLDDLSIQTLKIVPRKGGKYMVSFKVHYTTPRGKKLIPTIKVIVTIKNRKIIDATGLMTPKELLELMS